MAFIDHDPSSHFVKSSRETIWSIVEELYPRYRALCGPDFHESLKHLQGYLDLEIKEFPTGSEVGDWTIPPEFVVNEAWVEGPDGARVLDFADHPYHVHIYSTSFDGEMPLEKLLEKISTHPDLTDTIHADTEDPAPGEGFFYVLSYVDNVPLIGGYEGGLGKTSAGLHRTNSIQCP